MKAVVDRIEDEIIVLITEDERVIEIKKEDLDFSPKENDSLSYIDGKWILDNKETISRLDYIKRLTENMWKD